MKAQERHVSKKIIAINFIWIALLLNTVTFGIMLLIESNAFDIKHQAILENESRVITIEKQLLADEFDNILSDLKFLSQIYQTHNDMGWTSEQIAEEWLVFSSSMQFYDQVRFLNASGDEVIRINHKVGVSAIVPDNELQNKKDRYYFTETAKLRPGQYYISKMDLNIENNEIEQPLNPAIRFATPIYSDGVFKGMVVLNYSARYLLEQFRTVAETSIGEVVLLNAGGYWLSSENPDKEWGFMYDDKAELKFSRDYTNEWAAMSQKSDQFTTSNGLFTYSDIFLNEQISALDSSKLVLGDGSWIVLSVIDKSLPEAYIAQNDKNQLFGQLMRENYVYSLLIFGISLIIALLIYAARQSRQKIKYFSEYDTMTDTLNRRAGLERLNSCIPTDNRRKSQISLCFVDINGLKVVNDTLGHDYGDQLIKSVALGMQTTIRDNDFVVRLGGDEFLIVLTDVGPDVAEQVWQRIVAYYEHINDTEDRPYIISVSHGLVAYDNLGAQFVDDLLRVADERMYAEKAKIKANLNVLRTDKS